MLTGRARIGSSTAWANIRSTLDCRAPGRRRIEVYTYGRSPAENVTVLSWSEDPATHERWPMEWTVEYGRGRAYSSTFGHVWRDEADPVDLRCAGFQTILVRALQWLGKRPVTYPVPPDFPNENTTVLRALPPSSR